MTINKHLEMAINGHVNKVLNTLMKFEKENLDDCEKEAIAMVAGMLVVVKSAIVKTATIINEIPHEDGSLSSFEIEEE